MNTAMILTGKRNGKDLMLDVVKTDDGFLMRADGKRFWDNKKVALRNDKLETIKATKVLMEGCELLEPVLADVAKPADEPKPASVPKPEKKKRVHVKMARTAVSFPDTAEAREAVLAFCTKLRDEARKQQSEAAE